MRRSLHAGLGTLVVLMLAAVAAFAAADGRTIEVNGHGEAKAKPDTMLLSFAVDAKGVSADESTNLLTQRAKALTETLKPQVGDKGSITTSDFSIQNYGAPGPESESAAAWNCSGMISAETPDIASVGKLVDAAMKAGAELSTTQLGSKRVRSGLFSSTRVRTVNVSLQFEVQAVSADQCTRTAFALDQRIERAVRDELHGNGGVSLSAFRVTPLGPRRSFHESASQQAGTVFDAHETVTVKSADLALLGPLIDAASKNGASLNSLTFTLSDDAAARTEAIGLASKDAQAKAVALASSMGVKLGPALRISTNAQASPQEVYGMRGGRGELSMALGNASERLVPREVGYNAEVAVTYQIE